MKTPISLLLAFAASFSHVVAQADVVQDSAQASQSFHSLFNQALPAELKGLESERLHYVLDDTLKKAMTATTIDQALKDIASDSIDQLALNTQRTAPAKTPEIGSVLKAKPITVVVIPGVFAELIKTRAFDDIFDRPSAFATQFAKVSGRAADVTLDAATMKPVNVKLADVIQAGSIDGADGQPLVKVILFKTPFLSLESVGDLDQQAKTFTRRLEKYLALTGRQDLVFVGYSRGTTTGLQMLSEAASSKRSWLKSVKGMVSLGGVVSGSTLADALDDPNSAQAKGVAIATDLVNELQLPAWNPLPAYAHNAVAYTKFAGRLALILPSLAPANDKSEAADSSELSSPMNAVAPSAIAMLAKNMFLGMGLNKWFTQYSINIQRFKRFVQANIMATQQLRTSARVQWWKTHTVPVDGITYYSLAASMADPATSQFQKDLFAAPTTYSQAYDDKSLLQNHRDYTKASGVQLNDSQVGVAQAMFLPDVIHGLNPAQAAMKIENLGVVQSHHWGLALRVVNEMKNGRMNPFPRTALLEAIAAQVALDQQSAK